MFFGIKGVFSLLLPRYATTSILWRRHFRLNNAASIRPLPIPSRDFSVIPISFELPVISHRHSCLVCKRQEATGQPFPSIWTGLRLCFWATAIVGALAGFHWEMPVPTGF